MNRLYYHLLWYPLVRFVVRYRHLIGYMFLVIGVMLALTQIHNVQADNSQRSIAALTINTDLANVLCEARKLSVDSPIVAKARNDLIHIPLHGIPSNGARALVDLQIVVARGPVAKSQKTNVNGHDGLVKAESKLIKDLQAAGKNPHC